MPIFFQHEVDDQTRLAIWKIEEGEVFFLPTVPLQQAISHPHKRLQHLAGRYLLRYLFPAFPLGLIRIADTRKPFLENEAYHFSISHCQDFAAVLVSRSRRVGIDIELVSDKTERVRHKFMNAEEEIVLAGLPPREGATLLWCIKEAVFKWYGAGGLDFRGHMELEQLRRSGQSAYESKLLFKKKEGRLLDLHSCFFSPLCLSYVTTPAGEAI